MIPRYEQKDMSLLWSDEKKFQFFLEVELALLETLEENNFGIPKGTAAAIRNKAKINPTRINEIEQTTQHDVIAFCTSVTEQFEANVGRLFHFGVTSSDVIDTALTLQLRASLDLILPVLKDARTALWKKSEEYKNTICMGRSHGMSAEPMSFGSKFLSFYCEFSRIEKLLTTFIKTQLTGQLSGAVGNYTILTPEIEEKALKKLNLKAETISSQVIPRDRVAQLISIHAQLGNAIERACFEIRHLHHSDINELHEGFKKGQKGSSTMPHKKNPIASENLTGIARLLRSHALVAFENVALWHERDISHSSAERLYLPDNMGLVLYALRRFKNMIENLNVHTDVIETKVKNNFTYLSSYYLHHLIRVSNTSREELYEVVQKAAFEATTASEFQQKILSEAKLKNISLSALPEMNFERIKEIYLAAVPRLFERARQDYPL